MMRKIVTVSYQRLAVTSNTYFQREKLTKITVVDYVHLKK